ncbi:hypothetical protein Btru_071199 [Bulinus truncatus]|nr:hypothetical protein Btru_071199 [Bulinus truncatus]
MHWDLQGQGRTTGGMKEENNHVSEQFYYLHICSSGVIVMLLLTPYQLVLLFLSVASIGITALTTSGDSGDVCDGQRCLKDQAKCINQRCQCLSGRGSGNFACYNKSELYAELKNDPVVITFAHERVDAHLPCRALFAHVQTRFYSQVEHRVIGHCEIKVFSFAFRVRGKYYTQGFDAYISVRLSGALLKKEVGIRIDGRATDGIYTFNEWGKESVNEDDPWESPISVDAFGQDFHARYDSVNNLASVNVASCGLRIQFRPASIDVKQKQLQVPGLSVALARDYVEQWLSRETVLALPPFEIGPTLGGVSNQFNVAPNEAILARALGGAARQNFPGAPLQCSRLVSTATNCSDKERRKEALELCSSLLMWPKFVRCYVEQNGETDGVLELFRKCFDALCERLTSECLEVENTIKNSQCIDETMPELTGFNCQF